LFEPESLQDGQVRHVTLKLSFTGTRLIVVFL